MAQETRYESNKDETTYFTQDEMKEDFGISGSLGSF